MEDVKLEFPSLPQCKEDAEVSLLGDRHTQASPCGFSAEKTPGPSRRSRQLHSSPAAACGRPGTAGAASPSCVVPLPLWRRLGLSLVS